MDRRKEGRGKRLGELGGWGGGVKLLYAGWP